MNTITFNVNNGKKLRMIQKKDDGNVIITTRENNPLYFTADDSFDFISAGDMVMMLNYYRYIKSNDIRHDFINPNGKNEEV